MSRPTPPAETSVPGNFNAVLEEMLKTNAVIAPNRRFCDRELAYFASERCPGKITEADVKEARTRYNTTGEGQGTPSVEYLAGGLEVPDKSDLTDG